jgi:hypothetical protein
MIQMSGTRIIFLIFIGVGVYGIANALQMPIGKIQDQGPGLFPLVLAGLLGILSFLGLIASREEKQAARDWKKIWGELRIPVRIVLLTVGAIYFWESLGYLVVCPLYLFLLFYLASDYSLPRALIVGVLGGVLGWFFFARFLGVMVPLGILPF